MDQFPTYMLAIEDALQHGYSVITETGEIIGLKGRALTIRLRGSQRYPTVSLVTPSMPKRAYAVPAHKVVAYVIWGRDAFKKGTAVRHREKPTTNIRSDNLLLGSHSDNEMDKPKEQRVRAAKIARAAQGYKPPNTILTEDQVRQIRSVPTGSTGRARWGELKRLAEEFGVSSSTVSMAFRGYTHKRG